MAAPKPELYQRKEPNSFAPRRPDNGQAPSLRADRLMPPRIDARAEPRTEPVAPPAPRPEPVVATPEPSAAQNGEGAPADEVEARVRESARGCMAAYRGWREAQNDATEQALRETVHELRKVLARIEIEMSAGRRDERALKPIPIPAHRAARRIR